MKIENNIILSVTGLGYVGLPLALEFAKKFTVIGFDINESRVALMKQGIDPSNELGAEAFANTNIIFTSDSEVAREANFHIIGVPTDIDKNKVPNLNPLLSASGLFPETIFNILVTVFTLSPGTMRSGL